MRKVLALALASAAMLTAVSSEAKSRQTSPGCNTTSCSARVCASKACRARVAAKHRSRAPHRAAVASWYGPGLYGHPLACGGRLSSGTLGVAHKSIGCGTPVDVCARRCVTVPVVDRGPFVAGREFDLTAATAQAVGFGGVGTIRVRVGQ